MRLLKENSDCKKFALKRPPPTFITQCAPIELVISNDPPPLLDSSIAHFGKHWFRPYIRICFYLTVSKTVPLFRKRLFVHERSRRSRGAFLTATTRADHLPLQLFSIAVSVTRVSCPHVVLRKTSGRVLLLSFPPNSVVRSSNTHTRSQSFPNTFSLVVRNVCRMQIDYLRT